MKLSRLSPLVVLALWCCAGPKNDYQTLPSPPPESFGEVSDMLAAHCGSLDCHGSRKRNFVVFSVNGLRLDPKDVSGGDPDLPGASSTTAAERTATYQSFLGLEPELIQRVLSEGGAAPERLTLVRKARNEEKHTGGQALVPGGDGDRCLTSWLAGALDSQACAADDPRFPIPPIVPP